MGCIGAMGGGLSKLGTTRTSDTSSAAVLKPGEVKRNIVDNNDWRTESFGRITFKIESSWDQEQTEDGRMLYYPPTTDQTGFIQCKFIEASIGNVTDEEARTRLDGGISGAMGTVKNAEEISRDYLKIGDKYAFRVSYYFDWENNDINDDKRGRVDMLCVLFEDGSTVLTSIFTTSEYEYSYKNIIETALNSVELAKSVAKPAKPSGSSAPAQSVDSAYQAIFDEYSKKIRTATPRLIDEYNSEAAQNTDGLQGLAGISMAKVSKLAEISNEGVSEMAKIMISAGTGKYEAYEAWSMKLMDVYTEEAQKITDAYMASVSF
jgi:hypothetical protein